MQVGNTIVCGLRDNDYGLLTSKHRKMGGRQLLKSKLFIEQYLQFFDRDVAKI